MSYGSAHLTDVERDIRNERRRQHEKWGEQNHPDGTGTLAVWALTGPASYVAQAARSECQRLFAEGAGTWLDIFLEEVAEAFAESDPETLRTELVQVAAVAVAWLEAIDRRTAKADTQGGRT